MTLTLFAAFQPWRCRPRICPVSGETGTVRVPLKTEHETPEARASVVEYVRILKAQKVQPASSRQEGEACFGQLESPLTRKRRLELRP